MAKRTITTFVVRGTSPFPVDMLRYDQAWPARQEDVLAVDRDNWRRARTPVGVYAVTLQTNGNHISDDRWRSFGWLVTERTTTTY